MLVAILFEDGNPIRAFKDNSCIYSAYKWTHKNYCLADEGFKVYQLPDWLKVEFYPFMTEEQFEELTK